MPHERFANGLGWVAMVGGTVTAGVYSTIDAISPAFSAMQPDTISTYVVIGTNAVAALSGAALIAYNSFAKARREAKIADDVAFAASWEGKFNVLQTEFNLLKATSELTAKQRDFLRDQLDFIRRQNDAQTHAITKVSDEVHSLGTRLSDTTGAGGDAAAQT